MLTLYTFTISHFSEKIRWLLDAADLDYVEQPLTPGLHVPAAKRLSGRGTSVPILRGEGDCVQDSRRILRWLAERGAIDSLLPADPTARESALAIEAAQDGLGFAVMRAVYAELIDQPPLMLKLWSLDASATQRGLLRLLLPALRPLFRLRVGLGERELAAAHALIAERLDSIAARVASGRRYEVGEAFTVADLATVALLAPIAAVAEHPVYGAEATRGAMSPTVLGWQTHPGLEWVRAIYREHRPAIDPAGGFAAARRKLDGAG